MLVNCPFKHKTSESGTKIHANCKKLRRRFFCLLDAGRGELLRKHGDCNFRLANCSGGLLFEAARYRACASRTAATTTFLRKVGYGCCTCGPNGARWTISMRVPQGSVMYVIVLPVGDLRTGSSSLIPSAWIFFTNAS